MFKQYRPLVLTLLALTLPAAGASAQDDLRHRLTLSVQWGVDKSWAFSLGPTGGVLVGLGPVEVMGEVQFRFMGGLSDVDWLVEEGLRDINSESSRWSFPILIGARLRF